MTSVSSLHSQAREIDMLADVSRAQGLAQALANPITKDIRPGSMEEVASEIVFLLNRVREGLLK